MVMSESQIETVSDGEIDVPEAELERLRAVIEGQKNTISFFEGQNETIRDLEDGLSEAKLAITTLTESHENEVEGLQAEIARKKQRSKCFWKLRCGMMLAHEELLEKKDDEIALLKNAEHSKNTTKASRSASLSVSSSRSSSRSTSRETKDNDEQETNQVDHSQQV